MGNSRAGEGKREREITVMRSLTSVVHTDMTFTDWVTVLYQTYNFSESGTGNERMSYYWFCVDRLLVV